jgi:hypothetical protein
LQESQSFRGGIPKYNGSGVGITRQHSSNAVDSEEFKKGNLSGLLRESNNTTLGGIN